MKKPISGFYYLIPILTIVIGLTVFAIFLVSDIKSLVTIPENRRITLRNGNKEHMDVVSLEEEGRYYFFIDKTFIKDVDVVQNGDESDISISYIHPEMDGIYKMSIKMYKEDDESAIIRVHDMSPSVTITHTINNTEYTAVMYVEVEEEGLYRVETTVDDNQIHLIDELLIRQFEFSGFVVGALKYLGILGITSGISITSFIVIFLKRRKRKEPTTPVTSGTEKAESTTS